MDLDFSPDELAFRDSVRAFLAERLPTHIRQGAASSAGVFVEPEIGQQWNAVLNEQGWLNYQWPASAGGPGWSPAQRYIFEKECAIAGAPTLTVLSLKLLAPVLYTFGSQAQKDSYLPRILSGEDYWCQGFSEPGSGSDLASLKCRAERVGGQYVINGSKIWTTHAHHANRIFCLVRTSSEGKPQAGISFLLVDMDQPGVTVRPIISISGDHDVNEVFFDNATAPITDLVGEEGEGWKIAKFLLENERGGSCHAPMLLANLDALSAAAEQQPDGFGGRMAQNDQWKRRVAGIRLSLEALEIIELRILANLGKGRPPGPQTSLVKMLASGLRQEIDLLAVDLHGDAGLRLDRTRGPPPQAMGAQLAAARYLNSRAWTVFGGTNEIQANIIAKTVLKL